MKSVNWAKQILRVESLLPGDEVYQYKSNKSSQLPDFSVDSPHAGQHDWGFGFPLVSKPSPLTWKAACLVERVLPRQDLAVGCYDLATRCGLALLVACDPDWLKHTLVSKVSEANGDPYADEALHKGLIQKRVNISLDEYVGEIVSAPRHPSLQRAQESVISQGTQSQPCCAYLRNSSKYDYLFHLLQLIYGDIGGHKVTSLSIGKLEDHLSRNPLTAINSIFLPLLLIVQPENPFFAFSDNRIQSDEDSIIFLLGYPPHTLEKLIKFRYPILRPASREQMSPPIVGEAAVADSDSSSDLRLRFIIYQIFRAMDTLHNGLEAGEAHWHGSIRPDTIHLSADWWVLLEPPVTARSLNIEESTYCVNDVNSGCLDSITDKWRARRISNFEYLLAINAAAGRHMEDAVFHPVFPWVTDFSSPNLESDGHWRDLTKSKFRLTKGDHQLDTTYRNSVAPHHIPESLSEITYYIYMARVTPIDTLCGVVRNNFHAREYPASIKRMYEWSPDEAIPEFFFDPTVFKSRQSTATMPDLELPSWCSDAEHFVRWHCEALESDHVSDRLHHWIDLNFGYKLAGSAAEEAKNVPLPAASYLHSKARNPSGFVQVFSGPHPCRESNLVKLSCFSEDKLSVENGMDAYPQLKADTRTLNEPFSNLHLPVYQCRVPSASSFNSPLKVCSCMCKSDMFSVGCVVAELYLRQPVFSSEQLSRYFAECDCVDADSDVEFYDVLLKVVPSLYKLPYRIRSLVFGLLHFDPSRRFSAAYCHSDEAFRHLFPKYFSDVYSFLSEFQKICSWYDRLMFVKKNLHSLLGCRDAEIGRKFHGEAYGLFETSPNNGFVFRDTSRTMVYLLLPSFLRMLRYGCKQTKSEGAVFILRFLGPYVEQRTELLKFTVEVFYELIAGGDWEFLLAAVSTDTVLDVLQTFGVSAFVEIYLKLLLRCLGDPCLPRKLRVLSGKSIVCICQNSLAFGPCLSIKTALVPLLRNWVSMATLAEKKAENLQDNGYIADNTAEDWLVSIENHDAFAIAGNLQAIFNSMLLEKRGSGSTAELPDELSMGLLVHDPLVSVISKLCNECGSTGILEIVIPATYEILGANCSTTLNKCELMEKKNKRRSIIILDTLALLSSLTPCCNGVDVKRYFFDSWKLLGGVSFFETLLQVVDKLVCRNYGNGLSEELTAMIVLHSSFMLAFSLLYISDISYVEDIMNMVWNILENRVSRRDILLTHEWSIAWASETILLSLNTFWKTQDVVTHDKLYSKFGELELLFKDGYKNCGISSSYNMNQKVSKVMPESHDDRNGDFMASLKSYGRVEWNISALKHIAPRFEGCKIQKKSNHGLLSFALPPDEVNFLQTQGFLAKRSERSIQSSPTGLQGQISFTFRAHMDPIVALSVDSDELAIASACRGGSLCVWSMADTPEMLCSIKTARPAREIHLIDSFAQCIIVDGSVRIWNTVKNVLMPTVFGDPNRPILSVQTAGLPNQSDAVLWATTAARTLDCIDRRVSSRNSVVASHEILHEGPSWPSAKNALGESVLTSVVIGGASCSPWIAASSSSGFVSVLEPRSGSFLAHWKAHEFACPRLFLTNLERKCFENYTISTSSRSCFQNFADYATQTIDYQLLSVGTNGAVRLWDVAHEGGFETGQTIPYMDTFKQVKCRMHLSGLPISSVTEKFKLPIKVRQSMLRSPGPANEIEKYANLRNGADSFPSEVLTPAKQTSRVGEPNSFVRQAWNELPSDRSTTRVARQDIVEESPGFSSQHMSDYLRINSMQPSATGNSGIAEENSGLILGKNTSLALSTTVATDQLSRRSLLMQDLKSKSRQSSKSQISIPLCSTVALWKRKLGNHVEDFILASTPTGLSYGRLELRMGQQLSRAANVLPIRDSSGANVSEDCLRPSVIQALPIRGKVLLGSETGRIYAID